MKESMIDFILGATLMILASIIVNVLNISETTWIIFVGFVCGTLTNFRKKE